MSNFSIAYQFKAMIGQFQQGIKTAKRDMNGLMAQIEAQNIAAKKMTRSLNDIGKSMTRNITVPVAGLATASVYSFAKMEKGLVAVKGLTNDKTWREFKGKFEDIQKQAISTGFSLDDVNESLFAMPSGLGVTTQSVNGYKSAIKLAVAGNATLQASTEGIIRIMASYGDQLKDTDQAASGLFEGQVIGVTNVQALASNIGKVTATSKLANLSFGTMISTAAGLTKVLPTEQATTAMNSLLASLLKPTPEQIKAIDKISDSMGIKLPKGAKELQKTDFLKVLGNIITIAKRDPDALTNIIPDQRAIRAMGNLTNKMLDQIKARAIMIDNDKKHKAINQAFQDQQKTATEIIKRFKGQLILLSGQIGRVVTPMLIKLISVLKPIIDYLSNLSPETKKLIINISLLAATIGPLLIVSSKLIVAFRTLMPLFAGMKLTAFVSNIGEATKLMGPLRVASLAIGAALIGWRIGKFIGQLKWVKDNITGPIAESIFGISGDKRREELAATTRMVNTKINLIKELKKVAAQQGYKGPIAPIAAGATSTEQAQLLIGQLAHGKVNLSAFANKTPEQIQHRVVIETKDPQNIIKNVHSVIEKKHVNVGVAMGGGIYSGF